VRFFADASLAMVNIRERAATHFDVRKRFAGAVPVVMYLKWSFRDVCWTASETNAFTTRHLRFRPRRERRTEAPRSALPLRNCLCGGYYVGHCSSKSACSSSSSKICSSISWRGRQPLRRWDWRPAQKEGRRRDAARRFASAQSISANHHQLFVVKKQFPRTRTAIIVVMYPSSCAADRPCA
jgi:hypothetical protein